MLFRRFSFVVLFIAITGVFVAHVANTSQHHDSSSLLRERLLRWEEFERRTRCNYPNEDTTRTCLRVDAGRAAA